jgi:hypothetical protein
MSASRNCSSTFSPPPDQPTTAEDQQPSDQVGRPARQAGTPLDPQSRGRMSGRSDSLLWIDWAGRHCSRWPPAVCSSFSSARSCGSCGRRQWPPWNSRCAVTLKQRTGTWRTAASQEGCQSPVDDQGKEISLLATVNVQRTGGLAARPGSGRRIGGRTRNGRGHGATTCVCCCCRRMGDAVTNRWWDWRCGCGRWARSCACARRPTGRGEGSER